MSKIDVKVTNHGSLLVANPLTRKAKTWFKRHIPEDQDHQYWHGGIVVEPRYIYDLCAGMSGDGLEVA